MDREAVAELVDQARSFAAAQSHMAANATEDREHWHHVAVMELLTKMADALSQSWPPSREQIARVIAPLSWAALGTADTLAHRDRRTSSLRKADAILAIKQEKPDV